MIKCNKVKIKDFAEVITGGTPSTNKKEYWDGNIPWLPSGVCQDCIVDSADTYITDLGLKESSTKVMPINTVLIALTGATTGKTGILKIEACANQSVTGILPNEKYIPNYLFYYLISIRDKILFDSYGGAQKHISQGYVKEIEVPLPNIEEQKKIVKKLDKTQKILDIRKKQIEDLDNLIKSQFIEMFENEKYAKIKLGEEFDVSSGGTPSKNKEEFWNSNDISWIGSNMCQNKIIYENDGKYISYSGLEHSSAKVYPVDTILIALVGATIGKTALLKFETATNQNIAGVQVSNRFNAEYVYFAIQNLYYKFTELGKGTFKMANLSFIRNLEIPMPPIELQNQFAYIVKQVDKQKLELQKSLEVMKVLQESLMEKYFN